MYDDEEIPIDISGISEDGRLIVSVLLYTIKQNKEHFNALIEQKDREIKSLNDKVRTLERKVSKIEENFEEKLDSMEAKLDSDDVKQRVNSVIFSGPSIPTVAPQENCISVVSTLLQEKYSVNMPASSIVAAQRIGKKPQMGSPDKRNILVKFSAREVKKDLLQSSKSVRPDGLYIREDLTPTRNTILYALRQAKRSATVQ